MGNEAANTESTCVENARATKALGNLRMRLLDLTARNRLINFPHNKKGSLRIIDELPDHLAETLLADKEMHFLPVPEPSQKDLIETGYLEIDKETGQEKRIKKGPNSEEWAKQLGLSTAYEVPESTGTSSDGKHTDNSIQTLLYPYELETRLKNLLQTAQSAIEEMGTNILFLAFGFLEWFETDNEDSRDAPLFLVPVRLRKGQLNKKTRTYEYTLGYSGEDIIPNLSLKEKLRADFAMSLPDLDEEISPETYFQEVQALIEENQPRWQVRRYITMVLLNFSKLLMYLDLDPSRWPEGENIIDHRVVNRFLENHKEEKDESSSIDNLGFGEEHPIDEMEDIHVKYPLIDDADSSQHSALIDAVNGKDLVIEGPPGTGKSQTITNLIAASMSQGKKVLFVAEKLAALEVVRRRLDAAGLGDFCLELHGHKSQKRKVLDEVDERIKRHGTYRHPQDIAADTARYEELKSALKIHAERINSPWKRTGYSLHEIFMAATRYRPTIDIAPSTLASASYDGFSFDPAAQRRTGDQVKAFRKVYKAVAVQLEGEKDLSLHPWYGVYNADLQILDLDEVTEKLYAWQDALRDLGEQRDSLAQDLKCDGNALPDSLAGLSDLLVDFDRLPELNGDELLGQLHVLRGDLFIKAQHCLKLFEEITSSYEFLGKLVDNDLLRDLSRVEWIVSAGKRLQWVTPSVDLGTLATAVKNLEDVSEQLAELEDVFSEIKNTVGERAENFFNPTESGLSELARFIELVASLGPQYWNIREEIFENDLLDELLPSLRDEVEHLRTLQDEIGPTVETSRLPSVKELRQLSDKLGRGGVFSWFSSDWRTARKQLLGFATKPQVKYSALRAFLDKAANFAELRTALIDNCAYQEALGNHFIGLSTDVKTLETVRDWYQRVRQTYGLGFGKKVVLGDAIIDLPETLARDIRSLADQKVPQKLRAIVGQIHQLKPIFAPVQELQSDNHPLSGKEGIITRILTEVPKSLHVLSQVAGDHSLTMSDLSARIEKLRSLKKSVDTWEKAHFDEKVFEGRLGLQVGLNVDNRSGLSALRNTLAIAAVVDGKILTEEIRDRIYAKPTADTFRALKTRAHQLRAVIDKNGQIFNVFEQAVSLSTKDWHHRCGDQVEALIARNQFALNQPNALQNWLDYVRERNQLESIGLVKLAEHVENGAINIEQSEDAHRASMYDLLAREILREHPELGRFSGHSQEALQEHFSEYDNRLKRLQCERIAYQVDLNKIPNGNPGPRASDRSELFLLKHECSKKSRHIPIRQLLRRAGNALSLLKPCFMMGPMSVAQYLAPGQIRFDLVVMDEASQIKPQDALGAIARGAQVIVVGDPKQLPPTSFFDRMVDDDEEDPTGIEESESILDAMLPIFPARRLRWHYRSQHQSLIAFSNYSFYDSDLVLFPSPHKEYGIRYSRLKRGCFVNRRNLEEAKVISEAVREHFRLRPEESIGVVAMNTEQRHHIDLAIETLAKDDPLFQEYLEKDSVRQESFFVKNLENVQGDERDVIFVSMTYGPQEPGGKVYQRFGPINSDVGWRRLNVLFTRSKKRMHIFSSMGSDDIVAGSESRRGVKALRVFLSYCETGILHNTERETGRDPGSDFEIAVAAALRDEGFECVPQVGAAGYFIDVAVLDPGNPSRFLMGIECDGATYHSAKSVRDRDRLRQDNLERLGWNIRRIWSTDWFRNPRAEIQPIIRELHERKSTPPLAEAPVVVSEEDAILNDVEEQEALVEEFAHKSKSLQEKLMHFDRQVIRRALPDTPDNKRLLRPAMLEALIEFTPTNKAEFCEFLPFYLRQATTADEGQYLEPVFEIINASLETTDSTEGAAYA